LLVACTSSSDQVTGLPGYAKSVAEFESRLDTLRVRLQIPGMSAAIASDGRIAWQRPFGLADISANAPVRDTTAFHLASLTKMFAAVVLLRLADSGLIALDDPVSKYGVQIPNPGAVRVRHLMSMTSGGATPGEQFQYNGDRFALLDGVIRQSSGRSFADLVSAWIIRPLALTRTAPNVDDAASFQYVEKDAAAYRATMAKPYALADGSVTASRYPSLFSVAAGMISTAADMARFSLALDSGTILSSASRARMYAPAQNAAGQTLPYALGCFSQLYQGVRIVWAYGLWTANSSLLIKVPDRGLTFVVLANTEQLSARYRLGAGDLLDSPVAREFLNTFVFNSTPLP
jgi:CubicO group peptidase (beta-lactamase class C family)